MARRMARRPRGEARQNVIDALRLMLTPDDDDPSVTGERTVRRSNTRDDRSSARRDWAVPGARDSPPAQHPDTVKAACSGDTHLGESSPIHPEQWPMAARRIAAAERCA